MKLLYPLCLILLAYSIFCREQEENEESDFDGEEIDTLPTPTISAVENHIVIDLVPLQLAESNDLTRIFPTLGKSNITFPALWMPNGDELKYNTVNAKVCQILEKDFSGAHSENNIDDLLLKLFIFLVTGQIDAGCNESEEFLPKFMQHRKIYELPIFSAGEVCEKILNQTLDFDTIIWKEYGVFVLDCYWEIRKYYRAWKYYQMTILVKVPVLQIEKISDMLLFEIGLTSDKNNSNKIASEIKAFENVANSFNQVAKTLRDRLEMVMSAKNETPYTVEEILFHLAVMPAICSNAELENGAIRKTLLGLLENLDKPIHEKKINFQVKNKNCEDDSELITLKKEISNEIQKAKKFDILLAEAKSRDMARRVKRNAVRDIELGISN